MKTIVIMNSKGGVGKTTLTDEFAFWLDREASGPTPIYQIADLDAQGGLIHTAGEMPTAGITIVDMPGEIGADDAEIARSADLIIVPMHNSPRDRPATEATIKVIKSSGAKAPILIVVNRYMARSRQDRDFAESGLREWLRSQKPLPNIYGVYAIPESSAFRAAGDAGRSVVTYSPRSSAAEAVSTVCDAAWDALYAKSYRAFADTRAAKPSPWQLFLRKEH